MSAIIKLLAVVGLFLAASSVYASSYPALDAVNSRKSYASKNAFNCGYKLTPNFSTGVIKLAVVDIRGSGSCGSSKVFGIKCEKYRNFCGTARNRFTICTNGNFYYDGELHFPAGSDDSLAPSCTKINDQLLAIKKLQFRSSNGVVTDYVLPGQSFELDLSAQNETDEVLKDYQMAISVAGSNDIKIEGEPTLGELAARLYGTLKNKVQLVVPKNSCSSMFKVEVKVLKGLRVRHFSRYVSVGKPVYSAKTITVGNLPGKLESTGTTTFKFSAVGESWPYNASIYRAKVSASINHENHDDIKTVSLRAPGQRYGTTIHKGEGKSGTKYLRLDISESFQGENAWGDWELSFDEDEWRSDGELRSFSLEMIPAVFDCDI